MLFGENRKLKQLFWGPSAQVESTRCSSWTPLRFTLQSKTALTLRSKEVARRLSTAGLQCHAEVEKRFPEGNPIHHVQRMLRSLIYLPLYHKYSIIYIRNNIYCEELKNTSNQLEKQIQLYSFHRGRYSVLNEPNTTSFLWSWKSLTYRCPCNYMIRKLCLKTCVHIICPFLEDFDPSCSTHWAPAGNQESWEESHLFLGKWQKPCRYVVICCFSSCFSPATLGFWSMYLLILSSQHLGSSILIPLRFYVMFSISTDTTTQTHLLY